MTTTYNFQWRAQKVLKEFPEAITEPREYLWQLAKLFEYYEALELTKETGHQYEVYEDIHPNVKLDYDLPSRDLGTDVLCIEEKVAVQCKLRQHKLSWGEIATFIGINVDLCTGQLKNNLILSRNECSKLTNNLKTAIEKPGAFFTDRPRKLQDFIKAIEKAATEPLVLPRPQKKEKLILRDYQKEVLSYMLEYYQDDNLYICMPTGSGKTIVMFEFLKRLTLEAGEQQRILVFQSS